MGLLFYKPFKCLGHRVMQVRAFYKPVIDEKVLVTSCFGGNIRLADEPVDMNVLHLFLHRYKMLFITGTQGIGDPCLQAAGRQVHLLHVVMKQFKG